MRTPEVMLLGGPNSGKTHYAGQLYGRLRRRPGRLQLREGDGTPTDLTALEEVLHCLEGWGSSPERGSERLGVNLKRGSHVEGFAKTTDERTPHGNHAPGEAARQA